MIILLLIMQTGKLPASEFLLAARKALGDS